MNGGRIFLLALIALGVYGLFVATKYISNQATMSMGEDAAVRNYLQNLADKLDQYRQDCGQYPTTEQGLDALEHKPDRGPPCAAYAAGAYLGGGRLRPDPWIRPYVYTSDGKTFTLLTYGRDGKEGGEGPDADIRVSH